MLGDKDTSYPWLLVAAALGVVAVAAHVEVVRSSTQRVAVVSPVGEHDLATADQLRTVLQETVADAELVVLDFARTTFVESTVLGVIVAGWRRRRERGQRLLGVNAHGIVARALDITGVDGLLHLAEGPYVVVDDGADGMTDDALLVEALALL